MRRRAPLWLAAPSRFAALPVAQARWLLAALAVLLLATLIAPAGPAPDSTDALFLEGIVEGVRQGEDYYVATADALRAGGYPLRPFVTFRLPTLAVVQAHLPPAVTVALLYLLALAVLAAWNARLGRVFARPLPRYAALLLLAGGMVSVVPADPVALHELWAGLLIALSLGLRRPGHWVEAVALGLAAMLIRETAALYVAVMAALALVEGRRREAAGWAAATAVLAIVVLCHAGAVAQVVRPLDQPAPGWAGMPGFGFAVKAMTLPTALTWIAAPLGVLALFGWAAWRDPLGLRVAATLAAYGVLLAGFGDVDTGYWALLVAPILPVGLAFVPDGLRDVLRAALDRRRITVTRVSR